MRVWADSTRRFRLRTQGFDLRVEMKRHGLSGVNITTPLKNACSSKLMHCPNQLVQRCGEYCRLEW